MGESYVPLTQFTEDIRGHLERFVRASPQRIRAGIEAIRLKWVFKDLWAKPGTNYVNWIKSTKA